MTNYIIDAGKPVATIRREIYGHFAEHLGRGIYQGIYVGEESPIPNENGMRRDVVEALRAIRVPVLRWPGGCFADEYHWMDGIGPKESRKRMINTHWGGVVEDNSFGTHEFFELCRQLGCMAYVNGNVGSGTVQEMSEWVEYMTFDGVSPMTALRARNGQEKPWRVDYFGVGNENWGCGGNMNPEFYANLYRRYQTYVRDYDKAHPIRRICCGANADDYEWTEQVLSTCYRRTQKAQHGFMDGLSLHYYVHPEGWEIKGSATEFDTETFYKTLCKARYMEELIEKHGAILDRYDPDGHVGLIVDEWGTWYTVEPGTNPGFLYQQNTMRDALVAALTLDIFNKHAKRVRMANLAQMVNVLQSVLLTEGEKMIKTPTYHVFDLYQAHQDAQLVESHMEADTIGTGEWTLPRLTESASVAADGTLHITLSNLDPEHACPIETEIRGRAVRKVTGRVLHGEMHAKNTFDAPEQVVITPFTDAAAEGNRLRFTMPACSVLSLRVE